MCKYFLKAFCFQEAACQRNNSSAQTITYNRQLFENKNAFFIPAESAGLDKTGIALPKGNPQIFSCVCLD